MYVHGYSALTQCTSAPNLTSAVGDDSEGAWLSLNWQTILHYITYLVRSYIRGGYGEVSSHVVTV